MRFESIGVGISSGYRILCVFGGIYFDHVSILSNTNNIMCIEGITFKRLDSFPEL